MTDLLNTHMTNNILITHLISFEIKNHTFFNEGLSYGNANLYIFNNGSLFLCINEKNVIWYNLYQKLNTQYINRIKTIFIQGGYYYNIDYTNNNNSYNIYTNILINNFNNIIKDNNEYNKLIIYKYLFYGLFVCNILYSIKKLTIF